MNQGRRYEVIIEDSAARTIRKLPRDIQSRVVEKLESLADNPRPPGHVKLSGPQDLYRVRVGNYRIVYQIGDDRRVVIVLVVAHRRDAYRGL
jgi:mRNA interferase RelE/StbE